ncbi:MAG: hypothetical protein ACHBNF_17760 [Chromatiales bacterium]
MLTSRVSAHIAALVLVIGLCAPAASQAWNFGYRSSQGSHAYGGYGYRHQGSHAYGGYGGYRHYSPRYSFSQPYSPSYRRHYQTPRYGYYHSFRPHRPYYRQPYHYPNYRWCPY